MKEQIQVAHCADLLIGVHGAGLEHYRFMRPRTGLIQVGWKGWQANYLYDIPPRLKLLRARKVTNCNATISEQAWQMYYKQNPVFSANRSREDILNLVDKLVVFSLRENIWKFADCRLDIEQIVGLATSCLDPNTMY